VPEEGEDIEVEKVLITDAVKALELLKLYEMQQVDGNKQNLQALERVSRSVYQRRSQRGVQQTLQGYFRRTGAAGARENAT